MGRLDHHLCVGAQRVNTRDWGWLCASPHAPGTACAPGKGDFQAGVLPLKLSEAMGWPWGICWQVGCVFFYHWREFCVFKSWEGGKEGEDVLPHQAAAVAISLSAQPQNFSSPASPSESGSWSTHFLSQSPKMSRIKRLGAVQRLEPGLCRLQEVQEAALPCQLPLGHCSGPWAAPPGDLQHTLLPAPINLLFSSAWHCSLPHLGGAMSHHEDFSDHPLPYICSCLCHWGAVLCGPPAWPCHPTGSSSAAFSAQF